MHKYLRAIGFSNYKKSKDIEELLERAAAVPMEREMLGMSDDISRVQIAAEMAPGMGIALYGTVDEWNRFSRLYYFPYLKSDVITTTAPCQIQQLADKEAYSGISEEYQVGISLIFFMRNGIEYVVRKRSGDGNDVVKAARLSALSESGKILLPVTKTDKETISSRISSKARSALIEAAKTGDESAMTTLSMEDLDLCANISRRIRREDVYTIVDTCFMPFGVECDQYTVIGTINEFEILTNSWTGEEVVSMLIESNNLQFRVGINRKDLQGEPVAGRRFKGEIWMQGECDFM